MNRLPGDCILHLCAFLELPEMVNLLLSSRSHYDLLSIRTVRGLLQTAEKRSHIPVLLYEKGSGRFSLDIRRQGLRYRVRLWWGEGWSNAREGGYSVNFQLTGTISISDFNANLAEIRVPAQGDWTQSVDDRGGGTTAESCSGPMSGTLVVRIVVEHENVITLDDWAGEKTNTPPTVAPSVEGLEGGPTKEQATLMSKAGCMDYLTDDLRLVGHERFWGQSRAKREFQSNVFYWDRSWEGEVAKAEKRSERTPSMPRDFRFSPSSSFVSLEEPSEEETVHFFWAEVDRKMAAIDFSDFSVAGTSERWSNEYLSVSKNVVLAPLPEEEDHNCLIIGKKGEFVKFDCSTGRILWTSPLDEGEYPKLREVFPGPKTKEGGPLVLTVQGRIGMELWKVFAEEEENNGKVASFECHVERALSLDPVGLAGNVVLGTESHTIIAFDMQTEQRLEQQFPHAEDSLIGSMVTTPNVGSRTFASIANDQINLWDFRSDSPTATWKDAEVRRSQVLFCRDWSLITTEGVFVVAYDLRNLTSSSPTARVRALPYGAACGLSPCVSRVGICSEESFLDWHFVTWGSHSVSTVQLNGTVAASAPYTYCLSPFAIHCSN